MSVDKAVDSMLKTAYQSHVLRIQRQRGKAVVGNGKNLNLGKTAVMAGSNGNSRQKMGQGRQQSEQKTARNSLLC